MRKKINIVNYNLVILILIFIIFYDNLGTFAWVIFFLYQDIFFYLFLTLVITNWIKNKFHPLRSKYFSVFQCIRNCFENFRGNRKNNISTKLSNPMWLDSLPFSTRKSILKFNEKIKLLFHLLWVENKTLLLFYILIRVITENHNDVIYLKKPNFNVTVKKIHEPFVLAKYEFETQILRPKNLILILIFKKLLF